MVVVASGPEFETPPECYRYQSSPILRRFGVGVGLFFDKRFVDNREKQHLRVRLQTFWLNLSVFALPAILHTANIIPELASTHTTTNMTASITQAFLLTFINPFPPSPSSRSPSEP